MSKFKFGDRVWHDIEPCGFGVVLAIENGECHVKFRSGTMDWFSESELTPATDWVKCSERMPETYTKVLVLVEVGNDSKQHIFVDELYESTKYGMLWQNNDNLVTHWMPLPALPQEVER